MLPKEFSTLNATCVVFWNVIVRGEYGYIVSPSFEIKIGSDGIQKLSSTDTPVGPIVGKEVGNALGSSLGAFVGSSLGAFVGPEDGEPEGELLGDVVGSSVGAFVGPKDGELEGELLGDVLGDEDGAGLFVGVSLGAEEG